MAAPTGLAGQIGFKSESTWGTPVTVDLFHCGLLSESIKNRYERIDSRGIKAGRLINHAWATGRKVIGGRVELELWDQPLATLLTHMFGDVQTTGAGPYTHTATPADLTGKGLTVQIGRPDVNGTVQPFTYEGCKVASWELACSVGEIPTLMLDLTAEDEATGTALASASYPSAAPFTFVHGDLKTAGSSIATVDTVTLSGDNALRTERFKIGSALTLEQLENGVRAYVCRFTADFESLVEYNRFINGDEFALVLVFNNGSESLTITCNVRYDGETPELSGPEQLTFDGEAMITSGTSDAAGITAVLINDEASAA